MFRARPLFLLVLVHAKQSRKCGCALSIPHSFIQSEREREREREGEREKERERERERKSEKEGGRERDVENGFFIFIFKRNDGCLATF
jgi:hypothetical protein